MQLAVGRDVQAVDRVLRVEEDDRPGLGHVVDRRTGRRPALHVQPKDGQPVAEPRREEITPVGRDVVAPIAGTAALGARPVSGVDGLDPVHFLGLDQAVAVGIGPTVVVAQVAAEARGKETAGRRGSRNHRGSNVSSPVPLHAVLGVAMHVAEGGHRPVDVALAAEDGKRCRGPRLKTAYSRPP